MAQQDGSRERKRGNPRVNFDQDHDPDASEPRSELERQRVADEIFRELRRKLEGGT
jgi:hypothetical protein